MRIVLHASRSVKQLSVQYTECSVDECVHGS